MIGDSPAQEWLRSCPPLPPRRRRQIWAVLTALAVLTVLCGVAGRYGL